MSFVPQRPSASAPSDGSRTITLRDSQPREEDSLPSGDDEEVGTLHLRGGPRNRHRPSVVWRDDVVDNEGAGRKSSKSALCETSLRPTVLSIRSIVCCIYHKPRKFDESSSEESSDSDSDSDSSCDRNHSHSHPRRTNNVPRDGPDSSSRQGANTADRGNASVVHQLNDTVPDSNAYERVPGRKSKKGKAPARNSGGESSSILPHAANLTSA